MKRPIFAEPRDFKKGDESDTVGDIRTYLARLGYFSRAQMCAVSEPLAYDSQLEEAVKKYQSFHGLEASGMVDEATRQLIDTPRCGVEDLIDGQGFHPAGVSMYVASGGKWPSTSITYEFVNGTTDLPDDTECGIVRQAFAVWAAVTTLRFTELADSAIADILISWVVGDHGDGSPFDGPGHVLAHAFFPPPINPHPGIAGDLHFDDAEMWSDTGGGGTFDLMTVAIHELGHSLGLRHSTDPNAIMYPTYSGPRHTLGDDDIAGIRNIYPPCPVRSFQRQVANIFG